MSYDKTNCAFVHSYWKTLREKDKKSLASESQSCETSLGCYHTPAATPLLRLVRLIAPQRQIDEETNRADEPLLVRSGFAPVPHPCSLPQRSPRRRGPTLRPRRGGAGSRGQLETPLQSLDAGLDGAEAVVPGIDRRGEPGHLLPEGCVSTCTPVWPSVSSVSSLRISRKCSRTRSRSLSSCPARGFADPSSARRLSIRTTRGIRTTRACIAIARRSPHRGRSTSRGAKRSRDVKE